MNQRTLAPTDPRLGLDIAEVERRRSTGLGNSSGRSDPRPLSSIVRANVLTRFNLLLGVLGAAIIATGMMRDALFVLVAVANTVIGVVQELRARRTLRRLELLDAPTARVIRSGTIVVVDASSVVLGDLIVTGRGDQVIADGAVVETVGLEVDESLLTGESDPVHKQPGDQVLSGSAVISGSGRYVVTAVGDDGFANGLLARARQFQVGSSEIRAAIDRTRSVGPGRERSERHRNRARGRHR